MRKDMNFFSPFDGRKKEKSSSDLYVYLGSGIVLVAIIGTLLWNSIAIFITNNSIKDYESKLNEPEMVASIEESNSVNVKTEALIRYDKEVSTILDGVSTRDAVTTKLLNKIFDCRPDEVKFSTLKISSKEIIMTGISKTKPAIAEFEHNLSILEMVQSVHIDNIAGVDEFAFDVKCVLKDVE